MVKEMMMMKFRTRVDDDEEIIASGGNNNTKSSGVISTDVVVVAVEAAEEEDINNNPNYNSAAANSAAAVPCSSCGNPIITCSGSERNQLLDNKAMDIHRLPGLPAGVKFDPTDQELLEHLEAKVRGSDDGISMSKLHPLLDQFIPTIQGEEGICYTHPQKLPGVSKDGSVRHFFHCPSKAYTTGTRKRRKVQSDEQGGETRWHKTGKTRPILISGRPKGYKKILVLYTNYGRLKKPQKTNWVMHQYHLGSQEEEKEGELVVSKVFYQTQPRQCGASNTQKLLSPKAKYHTSIIIHEGNTHQFIDRYESMSPQPQMVMENDMNQDTHRNTTQDTTLNHASDSSSTHQLQAPQIHTKLPLQVDASTYPL